MNKIKLVTADDHGEELWSLNKRVRSLQKELQLAQSRCDVLESLLVDLIADEPPQDEMANPEGGIKRRAKNANGERAAKIQNALTAIVRDTTLRKEIDRRVTQFYSAMSHELRTPMTSIRGAFGLLDGGLAGELSPMANQLVQLGRLESERMVRIIEAMLDVNRLQEGRIQLQIANHSLCAVVSDTLSSITEIAKNNEVKVNTSYEPGDIRCDAQRIIQVLTQLLSNAIKFSQKNSEVSLFVERAEDAMKFVIVDSGCGIPDSAREDLFSPFFQVDNSDSKMHYGCGTGLAIAKAIVEEHGGEIGVISEEGQGSTFWFSLPAVQTA